MAHPLKGRGALSNPGGRFCEHTTEAVDDGWYAEEVPSSIATSVEPDRARSIISTNDSPDIPFEQSINPYRGCEHGCAYCMSGDTAILMADGTTRPLAELRTGDSIYGTVRQGWYRRYVKTHVLAHWSVIEPAYRITLADRTTLVAGPHHRFLTERGWKFVTGTEDGRARRPHLTTSDILMGADVVWAASRKVAGYGYVDSAITRKRDISGQALKSEARLGVAGIEPLNRAMRLYDIATGTEDFIANGIVSHNCYARPSHAYLGLSSGLDFETRLFYKADAARLLTAELAKPGYVCKPIVLGANTDPYQPIEKRLQVTRSILDVLRGCRHPVSIVTKGTLILRDLDVLADMARDGLASVAVSVTTLDAELKRKLEPRAAAPQARLAVVRRLAAAGIPVGVLVAPVIPAITDYELESIVEAAAAAGARSAGYVLLRLPHDLSALFREWLAEHYPERAQHVMSLVSALRGGRDNDPRFGTRMRGTGPLAELLRARFQLACRRCGIGGARSPPLVTTLFRPPGSGQLELGI